MQSVRRNMIVSRKDNPRTQNSWQLKALTMLNHVDLITSSYIYIYTKHYLTVNNKT